MTDQKRPYRMKQRAELEEQPAGASPRAPSRSTARSAPPARRSARSPSMPACAARPSTATSPTRPRSSPPAPRTGRRRTRCPTSAPGPAIEDPDERLRAALGELYPYYRRTARMLENLIRDERRADSSAGTSPASTATSTPRARPCCAAAASRGRARTRERAAIGHALAFATWRSLAREQGLDDGQAAELVTRLVIVPDARAADHHPDQPLLREGALGARPRRPRLPRGAPRAARPPGRRHAGRAAAGPCPCWSAPEGVLRRVGRHPRLRRPPQAPGARLYPATRRRGAEVRRPRARLRRAPRPRRPALDLLPHPAPGATRAAPTTAPACPRGSGAPSRSCWRDVGHHPPPVAIGAGRPARRPARAVQREFDAVAARLEDGRRYLCGDPFTAADLTFAALAAPAIAPPEYGAPLPAPDEMPAEMAAGVRAFRAHPAGAFACRLFREER